MRGKRRRDGCFLICRLGSSGASQGACRNSPLRSVRLSSNEID
jgi:hypothetical protein